MKNLFRVCLCAMLMCSFFAVTGCGDAKKETTPAAAGDADADAKKEDAPAAK